MPSGERSRYSQVHWVAYGQRFEASTTELRAATAHLYFQGRIRTAEQLDTSYRVGMAQ